MALLVDNNARWCMWHLSPIENCRCDPWPYWSRIHQAVYDRVFARVIAMDN